MDKHHIIIYIDGNSYGLNIVVDHENKETTYEVVTSGNPLKNFLPEEIDWEQDHMLASKERIDIVEREQITRIIWTDILDIQAES